MSPWRPPASRAQDPVAIETSSGARLFEAHVERFNAGVRSGDFGPMVAALRDDARLEFVGIPVGPFEGRPAIDSAYRDMPPDDEIAILSIAEPDGSTVVGRYAWKATGKKGTMTLTHDAGAVTGLTVAFDPEPAATSGGRGRSLPVDGRRGGPGRLAGPGSRSAPTFRSSSR